jgi:hypothetical protein
LLAIAAGFRIEDGGKPFPSPKKLEGNAAVTQNYAAMRSSPIEGRKQAACLLD